MKSILIAAALAASIVLPASADTPFTLSSPDIAEGQPLQSDFVFQGFGCEGGNLSPTLAWSDAPEGTKSFAVLAYDPDAPTGSGWWHWVAFDIPAAIDALDKGAGSAGGGMPEGTVQIRNDYGAPGFGGACPPPGEVHRYQFTVFALGTESLGLGDDVSAALTGFMVRANALASDTITAVYTR